jgi:hypothetical protein
MTDRNLVGHHLESAEGVAKVGQPRLETVRQSGLARVIDEDHQLVHGGSRSEVRDAHGASHTGSCRGGEVVEQLPHPRHTRQRVVQRQLLPPPDHALEFGRNLLWHR